MEDVEEPSYKAQLTIFEEEMKQKIDKFRAARSQWLSISDNNQKTFTSVKEGASESQLYRGRCGCLTKLGLKTTLLRSHYQTLRPLKYWTFKKKLTESDLLDGVVEPGKPKRKRSKGDLYESCSSEQLWKREDLEECEQQAAALRGKKSRARKKQECKEKRASGPCKKAIKRLKAAKIKEGIIESCKCEEGRELTVVIKGICLCDKTNLNRLDLSKVCDKYTKMDGSKWEKAVLPDHEAHVPIEISKPSQREAERKNSEQKTSENNTKKSKPEHQEKPETSKKSESDESISKNIPRMDSLEAFRKKKELETFLDYTKQLTKKKVKYQDEHLLKGDGKTKAMYIGSDITVFHKFSSGDSLTTDSDTEACGCSTDEKEGEDTYSTPKVSFNSVETKALPEINKSPKMPERDSLNNLFIDENQTKQGEGKTVTPERKDSSILVIKKSPQRPQTQSMNNLLLETEERQGKTYKKGTKAKVAGENLTKSSAKEWRKMSNSFDNFKKKLGQKFSFQSDSPRAQTDSARGLTASKKKDKKDDVKRARVKLQSTPRIIPYIKYPAEIKQQQKTETATAIPIGTGNLETFGTKTLQKPPEEGIERVGKRPKTGGQGTEDPVEPSPAKKDNSSMVTLYINKPEDASEIGLTKEEFERMKENEQAK